MREPRGKEHRSTWAVFLVLALLLAAVPGGYAVRHWAGSSEETDLTGLERQAEDYWGASELRLEKLARRGDYLAALCVDGQGQRCLCVYDRDALWPNRWRANGGKSALRPGELSSWNYGSPQGEAVLVICGFGIEEEGYSFQNGGVTYLCPVEGDDVLDVFVIPDCVDISGSPEPQAWLAK